MAACDRDLEAMVQKLLEAEDEPAPPAQPAAGTPTRRKRGNSSKNEPDFDMAAAVRGGGPRITWFLDRVVSSQ